MFDYDEIVDVDSADLVHQPTPLEVDLAPLTHYVLSVGPSDGRTLQIRARENEQAICNCAIGHHMVDLKSTPPEINHMLAESISLVEGSACSHCKISPATLTCADCVGYPLVCGECWPTTHAAHRSLPGAVTDAATLDVSLSGLTDNAECRDLVAYVPPPLPESVSWRPGMELEVCVITWNMEMQTMSDDISLLLPKNAFHIIVVGTQECGGYVTGCKQQTLWEMKLMGYLGRTNYVKVKSHSMMAIHSVAFVHCAVAPYVMVVESAQESTGFFGGALGNKGGVGISLLIGGSVHCPSGSTRLLFVNCHLTPHQGAVRKRNEDIRNICAKLKLNAHGAHPHLFRMPSPGATRNVTEECDICFWCGDLNYRINGTGHAIKSIVDKHSDWRAVLRSNDQLDIERRKGNILKGFQEGARHFKPTYKYHRDPTTKLMTEDYDRSAKNRIPSWTDRVLCVVNDETCPVTQRGYRCVQEVMSSDHRPVVSAYTVKTVEPPVTAQTTPMGKEGGKSSACVVS